MPSPPPASPPAPFPLTRETHIRIDREGRFWNEGQLIVHEALWRSLASWIAIDPDSGRYILANSVNWAFVTVDDAPLVVRSLLANRTLLLTDGSEEPLDLATLRIDDDDVPYCDVHERRLPARFSRNAAYALLAEATVDDDGDVYLANQKIPRVPRGQGAPRPKPRPVSP